MKTLTARVFVLAAVLALLTAAALPVSAFADESDPPATEPSPPAEESAVEEPVGDTEDPAAEEPAVEEQATEDLAVEDPAVEEAAADEAVVEDPGAEEPAVEEPLGEDAAVEEPATEEPVGEDPAVEEPVVEEATVEDVPGLLAELPEGTELVVLDEQGEALPLASQEAAEILAAGDPMWCPAGVTPGSSSCVSSLYFTGPGGLLEQIVDKTVAGVIWIEDSYVGTVALEGGTVSFNGDDLGTTANYALTLKGGWSGTGTTITPGAVSDFNVSLSIINWHNDITLSDIVISEVDGGGWWPDAVGLRVETTGKVVLNRVTSDENDADGAYIDNCQWEWDDVEEVGTCLSAKDVIITDSKFRNNGNDSTMGGEGLSVSSGGNITLTNVVATGNHREDWHENENWCWDEDLEEWYVCGSRWLSETGNGAILDSGLNPSKNVIVTNSIFSDNDGDGLIVWSSGTITLNNVTASGNIHSEYYDEEQPEIDAGFHGGDGAHLENWMTGKGVTVNDSDFMDNEEDGLFVYSLGAINIKDITAIGNFADGAYLDNWWLEAVGGITLTGTNVFGENGSGLIAYSTGAIKINNLISNANGWRGAYLYNCNDWDEDYVCQSTQPITLTGTNEFKFNTRGLYIYSGGAISLSNFAVTDNAEQGAYIDNMDSTLSTKPGLALTGANIFNDNGTGLTVMTKGAINISNLSANNNHGYDEWDSFAEEWFWVNGHGAWLNNSGADKPMPVTITVSGGNTDTEFKGNEGTGLTVYSLGAISLTGVVAEGNAYGAYLNNAWGGAVGGITISGWGGNFSGNANDGLETYSKGAITITHLYAWANGGFGALIDNSAADKPMEVKLSGDSSFGNNEGGSGLEILSFGAISLNAIYATGNAGNGALLDNSSNPLGQTVSLTGAGHDFNDNQGTGLEIRSYGVISIAGLSASDNDNFGALLDNFLGDATKANAVTLSGNNTFERNDWTGLDITSKGAITINNVIASDNGGFGAFLDNSSGTGAVNVNNTATYWPEFSRNGLDGLRIVSAGAVTVKDLDAFENGQLEDSQWGELGWTGYGVYIDTLGNVMLGTSRSGWWNGLSNNFLSGLEVYTNGMVTLSNLSAWGNGWETEDPEYIPSGYGAYIWNADGVLKAVTVNSTNGVNYFADNASGGLYIYTGGPVTLNNLEARDNGIRAEVGDGVHVDTCLYDEYEPGVWSCWIETAPQPVNVKGNNVFENNWNNGLQILAKGAITVSNIDANYNGDGAELYNWFTGPSTPQNVTLSGYGNFFDNYNNGLDIQTYGTVIAANLDAEDNGQRSADYGTGVYINNYLNDAALVKPVTLTGNNYFSWNWDTGLDITSKGAITINNVIASDNGGFGAFLDNTSGNGAVTINNTPTYFPEFARNGEDGLRILSNGAVTVKDFDAYENGRLENWGEGEPGTQDATGYGVYIDNTYNTTGTASVTLGTTRANWCNGQWDNFLSGMEVYSNGPVTTYNLCSNNNGKESGDPEYPFDRYGFGVFIDNDSAITAKAVTLNGKNRFDDNALSGVEIYSLGAITMNNMSANYNGGQGVYADNCAWTVNEDPDPDELVCTNTTISAIKLSGNTQVANNGGNGLRVWATGPISVSNLESYENVSLGAWLFNAFKPGLPQAVSITGYADVSSNGGSGLEVRSYGAITAANVSSSDNGGYGAYMQNFFLEEVGGFWDGSIVLPILDSNPLKPSLVTLSGDNGFNGNWDGGLEIHSLGAITLSKPDAWGNLFGILLDNNETGAVGGVTITGNAYTSDNDTFGMDLTSRGAITINVSDMFAANNGGFGWHLDNHESTALTPPGVTLSTTNTDWAFDFDSNGDYGLLIESRGNITLAGLDANDNGLNGGSGDWGAKLDNHWGTGTVTVNAPSIGDNAFNYNEGDGLVIYSNGAITVNKLRAESNGWTCSSWDLDGNCIEWNPVQGSGVVLDNSDSALASIPGITLNGFGTFAWNADSGLIVLSKGIITLNNVDASDNGQYNYWAEQQDPVEPTNDFGWGAYIDNCGYYWNDDMSWWDCSNSTVGKGINLNGANSFNGNYQDGMWATSLGAIKGSNFTANNNRGRGAYLDNGWEEAGAKGGVTLTTTTPTGWNQFNNNGGLGLEAWAFNGAITVSNIMANGNAGGWAYNATWGGAFFEAWGAGSTFAQKVTLLGRNQFNNNYGGKGLGIYATGDITVNNVTANGNLDDGGASLNNCLAMPGDPCWGTGKIIVNGVNTFNGNNGDGLWLDSKGTISITKLTADSNTSIGVYVRRSATLTLSCASMTNNGSFGWRLNSLGTITLKSVWALGNNSGLGNTWLESGGTPILSRSC